MNIHANKNHERKRQSVANDVSLNRSTRKGGFQFVDNRLEAVGQRKTREIIANSPRNQQLIQLQEMANNYSANQDVFISKSDNASDVIQKQHKNIPAPNELGVRVLDFLNQRNHAIVKKFKMESKGTHGTNWMHAISIMQGIKAQIPKEMRTSDVTPEEGGFFVDISESGKAQSHEFAEMAAYGTEEEGTPPRFDDSDQKREEFKAHVKRGKGTRRAIILEIWGQKNARPEPRKKGQQEDEDIYRTNAHLLVATLKDSL
ncbi:hypothetical protein [Mangrovibacter plantisponsor]|uniref:Uncharacterized protein n=1 Tax=Mangrovibacter plantisponsor TaxID=451513 RepID=A0A317PXP8_9ENTR|nr:hypothetical protein [Mangrovibacter plantisponsor]PWW06711.1 hypothetical protein DES37_110115 [Mangrovibacter plantisponsor]